MAALGMTRAGCSSACNMQARGAGKRCKCVCAGGALQVGLPPAELAAAAQSAAVRWQPGENGTVEFTLPLTAAYDMLQQGALVLELENVTNADLSTELGTTLISALAQDNLTVALAMQPNQVQPSSYLISVRLACSCSMTAALKT